MIIDYLSAWNLTNKEVDGKSSCPCNLCSWKDQKRISLSPTVMVTRFTLLTASPTIEHKCASSDDEKIKYKINNLNLKKEKGK